MFYKLIQQKRDEWFRSDKCTVRGFLQYIVDKGKMRDAQIEAIKTYLYLKIACDNKPLWQLFSEGDFLSIDINNMPLTVRSREVLTNNNAAATLYEYACLKTDDGKIFFPELKKTIETEPDSIEYEQVFRDIFYGVTYPDYIFSLPMGAGKTYLMAAFIYIDLYFSGNEPDNKAFAKNFMILAPSGLKTSILPSIKTIEDFDPTWILPEPAASKIRNEIMFEVLDEQKTAKKSNLVRNPNAQKISHHQLNESLRGLVTITNAEKVILNKVDKDTSSNLFSERERKEINEYNELRSTIAKIPRLAIFIDEVHHASDGDIKLRQVVNKWAKGSSFNCVLGFSGTPYLSSADNVAITATLPMKNKNLSNVVYYYPLVDGIDNFLKCPTIKISDGGWEDIVTRGVEEFLTKYKETTYKGNIPAKQAIYCGKIENLEENVYPLVAEIVSRHGMNPSEVILKYHDGNKKYPAPTGASAEFAALDTSLSKKRIILLVQIGKEGWDCKSLTSVILPQKGACPQNMVLQTSCRCLRQVVRHAHETALIWMNSDNGKKLNKELQLQQHTSITAINNAGGKGHTLVNRYSRMDKVKLPPITFVQLKVSWSQDVIEQQRDVEAELRSPGIMVPARTDLIRYMDVRGNYTSEDLMAVINGNDALPVTFSEWAHEIVKESMGTMTMVEIKKHYPILHDIYNGITEEHDGCRWLSPKFNHAAIRANIRRVFVPKRRITTKEETIPQEAAILTINDLRDTIDTDKPETYFPNQEKVKQIVEGGRQLKDNVAEIVKSMKKAGGMDAAIKMIVDNPDSYEDMDGGIYNRTYHYLPYHFDSSLETNYFSQTLLSIINDRKLEVYYNGDDTLTDFKIRCYEKKGSHDWRYLGGYVPDFLMLSRNGDNAIDQVLIIETKGEGYAAKFKERKKFMSDTFVAMNNKAAGYPKFEYLYIEDTLKPDERERQTLEAIKKFFK
ncbi:DEAD/DEAH box helicase family protein [Prevotella lacticifex]|uniref:Helicase/UvrB N-terminal domain-containing protein n=1 Tax=Prevotella lacticifex TaxID=2854755 RepID=A0A9R1C8E5_9BACT|nr:DEAD/DEAH box helicase family protein [Prevotella lacticifex]MDY6266860.1 DEAD/DEAH box helicase family protein [Prevotella sp.]GJG37666.1 hypothetical protein PRLR5003_28230 [Prevotella lacticifex]GJG40990.1 hypothetical protein PRLR5019_29610 [Prevotella lacticifex]GJG43540.1 hypothetical protein PRLR5025_23260 [Prevotella lacticifex]GJG47321.1 hypothetical protein PRLR5027_29160 [Prevotella lacticifex]